MEYKILESTGVEITHIDGAAFNNFSAGNESGVVSGILEECKVLLMSSTMVKVSTGELLIKGFRVKITSPYTITKPTNTTNINYYLIARIVLYTNGDVDFSIQSRTDPSLIQDNLFDNESGTYEIELARFVVGSSGITDLSQTIQILSGPQSSENPGTVPIDEIDASKVIFDEEVTTGYAVGNISLTNGKGILAEKGATLLQVMKNIWTKANPPTVVQPSVTISFHSTGSFTKGKCPTKGGSYEAGTKFDGVLFRGTFNKGSYEFDDDNGVEFEVRNDRGFYFSDGLGNYTDSDDNPSPITPNGYHVFPKLTVTENTNYVITGTANHTQGSIPHDSLGGEYPDGQITSTSTKGYSSAIKGYRNTFYGVLTSKEELTNDNIRDICWRDGMSQSNANWSNGKTFKIIIPKSENGVNIYRVLIAYPEKIGSITLQDLTEVIDRNDSNANIVSGFTLVKDANGNLLKIGGYDNYSPIAYKVYIQDFANPYDADNEYTVKI